MSAGWEIVKLDEVISFERGLTYAKGDEVAYSSVGVLRSNNVDLTTQSLNLDEIKYLREDFEVPPKKKVRKSSLLMCMSNGSKDHLGKVALIDRELDYAFGGFMGLLTPDEGKVFPKYLYYVLASKSFKDYIHSLADGANINNLKYKDLAAFDILLPSLAEQQRIVDILDQEFAKIDALKANAEKSLQAAKDLFQATLKKELEPKEGWKTQMIGQICILKSGNSNANNSPSGSLPFVKVGDMNIDGNEVFITCSSRYVDYESNKKGVFPVGSVIFPKRGGAILTNKKRLTATEICCDLNIMGVFPKYDILTPEYLFAFFQGVDMASIYDGAAIPQINNGDISPLRISFPNVQTQKCIVSRLEDLNDKCITLQQNYQKTLTLCDDLKQSLLRKAFNGEL